MFYLTLGIHVFFLYTIILFVYLVRISDVLFIILFFFFFHHPFLSSINQQINVFYWFYFVRFYFIIRLYILRLPFSIYSISPCTLPPSHPSSCAQNQSLNHILTSAVHDFLLSSLTIPFLSFLTPLFLNWPPFLPSCLVLPLSSGWQEYKCQGNVGVREDETSR